jgi:hypothetical protein
MTAAGFRCVYPNSGAFGFGPDVSSQVVGWVGPPDPTIREEARALTRSVPAPYEENLAALATRVWRTHLHGPLWVMPKSHWAYELDFGSHAWMPAALRVAGVDAQILAPRADGSAIEFAPDDQTSFTALIESLLTKLLGSDFLLAWPDQPTLCTVHHHKQLWWTTSDASLYEVLKELSTNESPG